MRWETSEIHIIDDLKIQNPGQIPKTNYYYIILNINLI